jgi:signal transduction histidine kinase
MNKRPTKTCPRLNTTRTGLKKNDSIAFIIHQLRTPITSTRWFLELLESPSSGKLNAEQRTHLRDLKEINSYMRELVDALLDITRVDSPSVNLKAESVNLPELSDRMIESLSPDIRRKKLKLAVDYGDVENITSNPTLLRVIIQNLITNAIKFTQNNGSIHVDMEQRPRDVLVSVSDTGCGIPRSEQGCVFSKFFRATNVQSKDIKGTGLGLYFVNIVVRRLKGRIWFTSDVNKGTTFFVSLPNTRTSRQK